MAWRNLWRHPARSLLILFSVAIGLAAGLFVLGLYRGMMQSRVRTVIDSEVGHVQMHHPGFKPDLEAARVITNVQPLLDSLRTDPLVRQFGTRSLTEAMLSSSSGSAGVIVQGVDMQAESALSHLSDKIVAGQLDSHSTLRSVVVGKKLADKQKIRLGSKVVLTVVDSSGELVSSAFRVVGIYRSSNTPFDQRNVFVPRLVLNELLGIGSAVHEGVVLLRSDDSTNAFVARYQRLFPDLQIESWRTLSPETDLLVSAVDAYSIIVLALVFLALSFGIINTMLMSVLERTREFGMMLALGMNRFRVFKLVMLETLLLVLAGLPAGFLGVWLLIDHYRQTGIDFSKRSPDLMRSFGFESVLYPEFPYDRLFTVAAIVLVTAFISGLFPAWRVLRLTPSEAMRK